VKVRLESGAERIAQLEAQLQALTTDKVLESPDQEFECWHLRHGWLSDGDSEESCVSGR
jgi:hypothetical protein